VRSSGCLNWFVALAQRAFRRTYKREPPTDKTMSTMVDLELLQKVLNTSVETKALKELLCGNRLDSDCLEDRRYFTRSPAKGVRHAAGTAHTEVKCAQRSA
jgi:hypothetical protein